MPKVKVLRSFNKTPQGDLADIGETIEVDDTRAQELARLGLAEPAKGAKAASEAENKMAPEPANKDAGVRAAARVERRARRVVAREKR